MKHSIQNFEKSIKPLQHPRNNHNLLVPMNQLSYQILNFNLLPLYPHHLTKISFGFPSSLNGTYRYCFHIHINQLLLKLIHSNRNHLINIFSYLLNYDFFILKQQIIKDLILQQIYLQHLVIICCYFNQISFFIQVFYVIQIHFHFPSI